MAIYDFEGNELKGGTDFTGTWRYIEDLPFTFATSKLQSSVVIFDKYIVVVGEDSNEDKVIFYFDVEDEKWFSKDGELTSAPVLCKYIAPGAWHNECFKYLY